jgi:hypothetical protein
MGVIFGGLIGGLLGLVLLNVMALIARNSGNPSDTISFPSTADVFAKADAWAKANGYRLVASTSDSRRYQKGYNFLTAPMLLEVVRQGGQYTLKSFVRINGLVIQGDMALTGSSFMAKLPRNMAKKVHNALRSELGLPLLQ